MGMFFTKCSYFGLLFMLLSWSSISVLAQAESEPESEAESLTFSVIPGIPFNGFGVALITELYARVGVNIKVVEIPPLREELMLEQGRLDGVVIKIESVDQTPPELIKIPVPIAEIPISVFVKGANPGLQKLLSQRPLRLGILRGIDYDLDLPGDIEWVRVNKPQQLMMMLNNGRLDAVITADSVGKYYIKVYDLDEIVAVVPPIQTLAIYHYIHQRHQHLVPRITALLQSVVDDGSLQSKFLAYQTQLLQNSSEPE